MKQDRYKLLEQRFGSYGYRLEDIIHIENVSYEVADAIKKLISTEDTDGYFFILVMDYD